MDGEKHCLICGKVLPRTKNGKINKRRVVCSVECRTKLQKKWRADKFANDPEYKKQWNEKAKGRYHRIRGGRLERAARELVDIYERDGVEEAAKYLSDNFLLRRRK